MTRTLITGATGTLGSELRPLLLDAGHEVIGASRSPSSAGSDEATADEATADEAIATGAIEWVSMDLAEGTGIEAALDGVDVVVHAASNATGDHESVDARGTGRLVEAAEAAGVSHIVYPSIVGIDEMTSYGYYEHKLAAEDAIREGEVPFTIVRATQFHEFVDEFLSMVAWLPIWPLPTGFRVQPIAAKEVAEGLVDHATGEPAGDAPPVGGPAIREGRALAEAYRSARGRRRPIVRLPLPGETAAAFRAGTATAPDRTVGDQSWEAWLAERYD